MSARTEAAPIAALYGVEPATTRLRLTRDGSGDPPVDRLVGPPVYGECPEAMRACHPGRGYGIDYIISEGPQQGQRDYPG